jgi:radical SAM protein with 4Fe4S-binding SPASM domain
MAKRSRMVAAVRHALFHWDDRFGDLYVEPLARNRRTTVDRPLGIYNIELTNVCPFRCVMCPRPKHMTRAQGYMSPDLFRRVIDEYVRVGPLQARHRRLWLHGFGESLLHPDLTELVRYAADRGVRPSLSVNPLLLTEALGRRLLEARLDVIHFSLDGHDDESFQAVRGLPGAYQRSRAQFLDFLAIKRGGGFNTKVVLSMLDIPLNRPSLKRCLRQWRATPGVDQVVAKRFTGWDGTAPEVAAVAPCAGNAGRRNHPVLCGVPWRTMTVLWDGDVVPCTIDFDKKYVLGNIAEQSLVELWNGPRIRQLRRELMVGEVTNPLCRRCWREAFELETEDAQTSPFQLGCRTCLGKDQRREFIRRYGGNEQVDLDFALPSVGSFHDQALDPVAVGHDAFDPSSTGDRASALQDLGFQALRDLPDASGRVVESARAPPEEARERLWIEQHGPLFCGISRQLSGFLAPQLTGVPQAETLV